MSDQIQSLEKFIQQGGDPGSVPESVWAESPGGTKARDSLVAFKAQGGDASTFSFYNEGGTTGRQPALANEGAFSAARDLVLGDQFEAAQRAREINRPDGGMRMETDHVAAAARRRAGNPGGYSADTPFGTDAPIEANVLGGLLTSIQEPIGRPLQGFMEMLGSKQPLAPTFQMPSFAIGPQSPSDLGPDFRDPESVYERITPPIKDSGKVLKGTGLAAEGALGAVMTPINPIATMVGREEQDGRGRFETARGAFKDTLLDTGASANFTEAVVSLGMAPHDMFALLHKVTGEPIAKLTGSEEVGMLFELAVAKYAHSKGSGLLADGRARGVADGLSTPEGIAGVLHDMINPGAPKELLPGGMSGPAVSRMHRLGSLNSSRGELAGRAIPEFVKRQGMIANQGAQDTFSKQLPESHRLMAPPWYDKHRRIDPMLTHPDESGVSSYRDTSGEPALRSAEGLDPALAKQAMLNQDMSTALFRKLHAATAAAARGAEPGGLPDPGRPQGGRITPEPGLTPANYGGTEPLPRSVSDKTPIPTGGADPRVIAPGRGGLPDALHPPGQPLTPSDILSLPPDPRRLPDPGRPGPNTTLTPPDRTPLRPADYGGTEPLPLSVTEKGAVPERSTSLTDPLASMAGKFDVLAQMSSREAMAAEPGLTMEQWSNLVRNTTDAGRVEIPPTVTAELATYQEGRARRRAESNERHYGKRVEAPPADAAAPEWEMVPRGEVLDKTGKHWTDIPGDDGYLYHVTTPERAARILAEGLDPLPPERSMGDGAYSAHSEGRAFVTDRGGVSFWDHAVSNHLEHRGLEVPPEMAVVRIPKSAVKTKLEVDQHGLSDANAGAWFTTERITGERSPPPEVVLSDVKAGRPQPADRIAANAKAAEWVRTKLDPKEKVGAGEKLAPEFEATRTAHAGAEAQARVNAEARAREIAEKNYGRSGNVAERIRDSIESQPEVESAYPGITDSILSIYEDILNDPSIPQRQRKPRIMQALADIIHTDYERARDTLMRNRNVERHPELFEKEAPAVTPDRVPTASEIEKISAKEAGALNEQRTFDFTEPEPAAASVMDVQRANKAKPDGKRPRTNRNQRPEAATVSPEASRKARVMEARDRLKLAEMQRDAYRREGRGPDARDNRDSMQRANAMGPEIKKLTAELRAAERGAVKAKKLKPPLSTRRKRQGGSMLIPKLSDMEPGRVLINLNESLAALVDHINLNDTGTAVAEFWRKHMWTREEYLDRTGGLRGRDRSNARDPVGGR